MQRAHWLRVVLSAFKYFVSNREKNFLNHICFYDCREIEKRRRKNNNFIVARVNLPTVGRNWGNVFINEQSMLWIYCYYGPWFKLFTSICFSPDSATEKNMIIIIIQSHSDKIYSRRYHCITKARSVHLWDFISFNFVVVLLHATKATEKNEIVLLSELVVMTNADIITEFWSLKSRQITQCNTDLLVIEPLVFFEWVLNTGSRTLFRTKIQGTGFFCNSKKMWS